MFKLITSFLSNRNFKVSVKGDIFTPTETQAGALQGSVLTPHL